VDGKEIKDGDKIIIMDETRSVVESGVIKFCVYDDKRIAILSS